MTSRMFHSVYSMKVGKSLTEKEFDMRWAGKAGPPHVTTHLCGDAMPTDLECKRFIGIHLTVSMDVDP